MVVLLLHPCRTPFGSLLGLGHHCLSCAIFPPLSSFSFEVLTPHLAMDSGMWSLDVLGMMSPLVSRIDQHRGGVPDVPWLKHLLPPLVPFHMDRYRGGVEA